MRTAIIIAAALTLLFSFQAYAAEAPEYTQSTLSLSGSLLDVSTNDMNSDGRSDIVAVSLKGDRPEVARRFAELFYQKPGGGFPKKPDLSWEMPSEAAVFDTADVTGSGIKSVCFIAPDGVYSYMPDRGSYSKKPTRIISSESVFTDSDLMDMPRFRFFFGTGGSADMAFVPKMSALDVYERGPKGYALVSSPGMPVTTSFSGGRKTGADSTLTVSHRVPLVDVIGFNDSSGRDIFMSWDDNALVYISDAGKYAKAPDISFRPGLLGLKDEGPMAGAWLYPADLDGDGRLDFIVTKKVGGMAHTRSLVFIYMRGPGGDFPAKPGNTIITEGVVGPRFVDLDGDGRLDIMLPSIKVGVSNFINMLTSGKVNVDVDIYMQDAKGGFPERPTKTKSVGFKLDLTNLAKAVPVLEAGRFTGSGCGLAVVSGEDSVSVFLPDRYSILTDRPGFELSVDAPTGMSVQDLNADGVDDFVLTYKGTEKLSGLLNVFISK